MHTRHRAAVRQQRSPLALEHIGLLARDVLDGVDRPRRHFRRGGEHRLERLGPARVRHQHGREALRLEDGKQRGQQPMAPRHVDERAASQAASRTREELPGLEELLAVDRAARGEGACKALLELVSRDQGVEWPRGLIGVGAAGHHQPRATRDADGGGQRLVVERRPGTEGLVHGKRSDIAAVDGHLGSKRSLATPAGRGAWGGGAGLRAGRRACRRKLHAAGGGGGPQHVQYNKEPAACGVERRAPCDVARPSARHERRGGNVLSGGYSQDRIASYF